MGIHILLNVWEELKPQNGIVQRARLNAFFSQQLTKTGKAANPVQKAAEITEAFIGGRSDGANFLTAWAALERMQPGLNDDDGVAEMRLLRDNVLACEHETLSGEEITQFVVDIHADSDNQKFWEAIYNVLPEADEEMSQTAIGESMVTWLEKLDEETDEEEAAAEEEVSAVFMTRGATWAVDGWVKRGVCVGGGGGECH